MNPIVTLWHAEHAKFTHLLDHLDQRVAKLVEGDDDQLEVVSDIVAYLHHYGERAHHPREDVGFARLAKIDAGFAPVVQQLHAEHAAIIEAGRVLVDQLDQLAAGQSVLPRDAIGRSTQRYLELQRTHLRREEDEIIPRLAERFKEADWEVVKREIAEKVDTRLPAETLPRFRQLSQTIAFELKLQ